MLKLVENKNTQSKERLLYENHSMADEEYPRKPILTANYLNIDSNYVLKVICMMTGCSKCMKIGGATFLILGIAFLLRDMNYWDFWNISWWTALFVVMGIGSLGSSKCPDCKALRGERKR